MSESALSRLYGSGVFTTIRIINGEPWLWEKHWRRLMNDAAKIGIDMSMYSEYMVRRGIDESIPDDEKDAPQKFRITVSDLKTSTSRAMYDHNQTRGKIFYMFAGAKGTLYSGILPGQDDEAVAYHSTGGVSGSSGGSYCNPGDWFCDGTLNTGTSACSNGKAKWSYHTVSFRDDGESYNHYANGNWAGIVGPTRSDVVTYAK